MKVLVDLGNSRLKWAVEHNNQLQVGQSVANNMLTREYLTACWQSLDKPVCLAIANVTSSVLLELIRSVATDLWPTCQIFISQSQAFAHRVRNGYAEPQRLGVDRWLALVAARYYYPGNVCIVDCGTAITVDLLTDEGCHLGGYIGPGLRLMKQALMSGTEQLPYSHVQHPIAPAQYTEAAIYAGTLAAAVGMIKQVLARQTSPMQCLLTGGDAELIANELAMPFIVDSELVLKGLAIDVSIVL